MSFLKIRDRMYLFPHEELFTAVFTALIIILLGVRIYVSRQRRRQGGETPEGDNQS